MNDEINIARRHRHGRAWERAWEPVPLTEQPWDWKTAGLWLLILLFIATFFAGVVWWVRMAWRAVQAVAG